MKPAINSSTLKSELGLNHLQLAGFLCPVEFIAAFNGNAEEYSFLCIIVKLNAYHPHLNNLGLARTSRTEKSTCRHPNCRHSCGRKMVRSTAMMISSPDSSVDSISNGWVFLFLVPLNRCANSFLTRLLDMFLQVRLQLTAAIHAGHVCVMLSSTIWRASRQHTLPMLRCWQVLSLLFTRYN